MNNNDQYMIEAQARIITQLRAENTKLRAQYETTMRLGQAGRFYFVMQKMILDNPMLQTEWTRFCSFLKMTEIEDEMKKLDETPETDPADATFDTPFMF